MFREPEQVKTHRNQTDTMATPTEHYNHHHQNHRNYQGHCNDETHKYGGRYKRGRQGNKKRRRKAEEEQYRNMPEILTRTTT